MSHESAIRSQAQFVASGVTLFFCDIFFSDSGLVGFGRLIDFTSRGDAEGAETPQIPRSQRVLDMVTVQWIHDTTGCGGNVMHLCQESRIGRG